MKHRAGFVNIIGNPNVGKSTLMNSLLEEKLSIVTNKAQTTRHRILGILNENDIQIIFSDTPGIIEPNYKLQESMMNFVYSAFKDADILIYMVQIGDTKINKKEIISRIGKINIPVLVLLNKIDLTDQDTVSREIEFWRNLFPSSKVLPISAVNKFNIDNVKEHLISLLPFSPPYYDKDVLTDKSERFFVTEIIREKILKHYKQEIPYSVEVEVEEFLEKEDLVRIRAIIFVMRESQRGILIGHKGMGLKRIGTEARKDIERMLSRKVFLETPIKIKKNWRNDNDALRKFGYKS